MSDGEPTRRKLPRRLSRADIAPDRLEALIRETTSPAARDEVASLLLDLTVRTAVAQSNFWRERLSVDTAHVFDRAALATLPLLERAELARSGTAIQSSTATWQFTSYTSGTTSGAPLILDRSSQESAYLYRYVRRRLDSKPGPTTLLLSLARLFHGMQMSVPSRSRAFVVELNGETGCQQAVTLLRRTVRFGGRERRITALAGGLADLMLLTTYVESRQDDTLTEGIDQVSSTGFALSDWARQRLSSVWGARVFDRYSLAEAYFSASRCGQCDWFHFDEFGLAEVVDQAGRPIEEGRGRLAVTAFYPFSQMTPLIRYVPGDLVEVRRVACPFGVVGYRILGREGDSATLPDSIPPTLLTDRDVLEVLEPLPDVARRPLHGMPSYLQDVGIGPIYAIDVQPDQVTLRIELRFPPSQFPSRVADLAQEVAEGLSLALPTAAAMLAAGKLRIRFVEPGSVVPRKIKQ